MRAMALALAIKQGKVSPSKAGPEVRRMADMMTEADLKDFSKKHAKAKKKKHGVSQMMRDALKL